MMSSWVIETSESVDQLKSRDTVAIPVPRAGEVRVKVMAASLNHADISRAEKPKMGLPAIMGLDGAGVVDVVGDGVDQCAPGDRVHFRCSPSLFYGTLTEYTILPASSAVPIPDELSFQSAAALPTAGWGAYLALHDKLSVQPGRTIYITGGAGGLGGYAVRLAKHAGLRVITSCSTYNIRYLKEECHADHIVDYTIDDIEEKVKEAAGESGVDYVLDTIGSESATLGTRLLNFGGAICVTAAPPTLTPELMEKGISLHFLNASDMLTAGPHGDIGRARHLEIARTMAGLVASNAISDNIGETIKWGRCLEALQTLRTRHVRGKLVVNLEGVHNQRRKLVEAAQQQQQQEMEQE
eukprot:Sspe_Gene.33152::Locus_16213_Transcript_1_1_Confidence_1.000_Length_1193::g.33152::m.33152